MTVSIEEPRTKRVYGERKIETRIVLPPTLFTELEKRRKRLGISLSEVIRHIVYQHFLDDDRRRGERIVVMDREKQMLRDAR